jgi:hypothetical protein
LPHAKISGPQGGVKHLLFGCERPKSECFNVPRKSTIVQVNLRKSVSK